MSRNRLIDETGNRYGRLVVIERASPKCGGRWLCRCDCGGEKIATGKSLRYGAYNSCGCLRREAAKKHGRWNSRAYNIWHSMKKRCQNPRNASYKQYGGRGIQVCERWAGPHGFVDFFADMGMPETWQSLDRIDVNGNYEPSNCRWATNTEQANNRRNSRPRIAALIDGLAHEVSGSQMGPDEFLVRLSNLRDEIVGGG